MIEKEIINRMLTNKEALFIATNYDPEIIEDQKLRYLFKIIIELAENGQEVDYSVLQAYLKTINKYDNYNSDYFLDLMSQHPVYNFTYTLDLLKENVLRNKIKDNARDLHQSVVNGKIDIDVFIDKIITIREDIQDTDDRGHTCIANLPDDLDLIFSTSNYLSFHIPIMDELLKGLFNGNLITLAGQPGAGKTSFALQIASYHPSLFVSLEMPLNELYAKIISRECEIPALKLETKSLYPHEMEKVIKKHAELKNSKNFHILTGENNFFKLIVKIKHLVKVHGLKLVVIDYIQLCQIEGMDTNSRIEKITSRLKKLAIELNIPIIILSQLVKEAYKTNTTPSLSDLRGSGSLAQDSDVVFILWFNEKTKLKLTVAKGRKYKIGTIDNLMFNGKFSRFEEEFIGGYF